FEQKLESFEESVRHDMLAAARHSLDHKPPFYLGAVRQLAVYFEMIGKYVSGFTSQGKSRHFFKEGCKEVNRAGGSSRLTPNDDQLNGFFELVRCGLYHQGVPSLQGVRIDPADTGTALWSTVSGKKLTVFPWGLLRMIESHFNAYVTRLR